MPGIKKCFSGVNRFVATSFFHNNNKNIKSSTKKGRNKNILESCRMKKLILYTNGYSNARPVHGPLKAKCDMFFLTH
jgi:hypothetical protein